MSAMDRARELAEELGNVPQLSPALWGLHAYYLVSGRILKSLEIAQRALAIAKDHNGEMALMTAHTDMGITLRFMGKYHEALQHFECAVADYDPAKQLEYHAAYHMDPGVFCLAEMTRSLWAAGYVDRSIETLDRVIELARKSPDPRTLAFALLMGSVLHHLMSDPDATLPYSEEGIELADEHQIIQERAWLTTSLGWAHAKLGKVDQGISEVETSLAMRRRMNAELDLPYALTQLAEAYSVRGDITRARATLHDAIEIANRNSDVWSLSETYRWLGDLALRPENGGYADSAGMSEVDRREAAEVRNSAAEAHYLRALEIANEQGARSFGLRAAVSLGKVMETDGRAQEAIDLVTPLRAFFDGQRATADSIDADMLLSRLRSLAQSEAEAH
jgi:tetratricopeptide (TPR) repeat protein